MSDIIIKLRASDHVDKYARYSNAVVPPPKPYMVRWPLSSTRLIRGATVEELVDEVYKAMMKRRNER